MKTRIKVCGITRPQDAIVACELGVDALGIIFAEKSPRYVTVEAAVKVVREVAPFVSIVGLFMNADSQFVNHVLESVKIDILQFHGAEDPEWCDQFSRPYIKAFGANTADSFSTMSDSYDRANAWLLDSHAPGEAGGTGKVMDWTQFPQQTKRPLILAGGLRAENVAEAIKTARPIAVDVSSGVESAPGKKDKSKLEAFMREVNNVHA